MGPDAAPAVPELVRKTQDPNLFVRWASARVLGIIGPREESLTVPALAKLLADNDLDVELAAAQALSRYGPAAQAALPQLQQDVVGASDARMRIAAINTIVAIGKSARTALPTIIGSLSDVDLEVQQAAADALGQFGAGATEALPALRQALRESNILLNDPNQHTRELAARARQAVSDAILNIEEKK
jgi:HEAT repeat protein